MKKIFLATALAAGLVACGPKGGTTETEGTEPQEVGSGDIAYVLVDEVLAKSDIYLTEGVALEEKTQKTQEGWTRTEQGFQYEVNQLQEKYSKGLITTADAEQTQASIERRARAFQTTVQKEEAALTEENYVFGNRAQELIRQAVKEVNADRRYKFIINGSALIDADSTLNITSAVLEQTNRLYAAEKEEKKKEE